MILKIESCDVFDVKNILPEAVDAQLDSYNFINSLYNKVFSFFPHKKPYSDISEKDFNIIKSFTNEKSFEKAVEVCLHLLKGIEQAQEISDSDEDDDRLCVSQDSMVVVNCLNLLIDCRIPHHFKPGFLIILVRYCYYEQ